MTYTHMNQEWAANCTYSANDTVLPCVPFTILKTSCLGNTKIDKLAQRFGLSNPVSYLSQRPHECFRRVQKPCFFFASNWVIPPLYLSSQVSFISARNDSFGTSFFHFPHKYLQRHNNLSLPPGQQWQSPILHPLLLISKDCASRSHPYLCYRIHSYSLPHPLHKKMDLCICRIRNHFSPLFSFIGRTYFFQNVMIKSEGEKNP